MQDLESKTEKEVLSWAYSNFGDSISIAFSGQMEDVVVLDLASKIRKNPKLFTLDTGRLPKETYELMDAVRDRYNVSIDVYFPDKQKLENMVKEHGFNLFYNSKDLRKMCCGVRKVEPLQRALAGLSGWITGLRRDQWDSRAQIKKVEIDESHGNITKVNPIADWSYENILEYTKSNGLPYNKLYEKGYKSIGCEPCTRPVLEGMHPRSGRWWWEEGDKECGLHVKD